MKISTYSMAVALLLVTPILLSSCSTSTVQDARAAGVDNRQDRIDSRTHARQDRWKTRAEREDARSKAWFDAM